MARYKAEIHTTRALEAVFDYLSRFDSAAEWDPGIESAKMLTPEPVGLRSRFELVARFAGGRVPLEYEIVEFEPGRRVVLRAENASIRSTDTISFHPEGSGTRVVYDALLEPKRARRFAEPVLGFVFRRIADRAAAGLRRALTAVQSS
jgi:carbon monoxide dehydrogenase subunit G